MEKEAKNFEDANSACTDKGGFLVEPRSAELSTAVATFTFETNFVWTGGSQLNSPSQFTWNTDNEPLTYTNWSPGQPNNYGGNQKCLALKNTNHKWDDASCTNLYHYICQANKRE